MSLPIQKLYLGTGEFHFSSERLRISTLLGSCVAFTAWHPTKHIGGMCHYLLPTGRAGRNGTGNPSGLYAEDAVELFEKEFRATGTRAAEYVVKMFGGGSMFPQHSLDHSSGTACHPQRPRAGCRDISCRNVTQGRSIFESRGFVINAADVGGIGSRQIAFDVWNGDVWIRRSKAATTAVEHPRHPT